MIRTGQEDCDDLAHEESVSYGDGCSHCKGSHVLVCCTANCGRTANYHDDDRDDGHACEVHFPQWAIDDAADMAADAEEARAA